MIVNHIYETTIEYGKKVGKNTRKKLGQFFTPPAVARYMAGLMKYRQSSVRILDTGAGTGILTGALCESILDNDIITNVHIDLYENDEKVLPILKENMKLIQKNGTE